MGMSDQEPEVWKPIPGVDHYFASSWGRVRREWAPNKAKSVGRKSFEVLPTFGTWEPVKRRYTITCNRKVRRVARLVCLTFHGEPPFPKAVVMHLDEDSTNNKPGNLAWGTQKQNLNAPGFLAYCSTRRGDMHPKKRGAQIS